MSEATRFSRVAEEFREPGLARRTVVDQIV